MPSCSVMRVSLSRDVDRCMEDRGSQGLISVPDLLLLGVFIRITACNEVVNG